MPESPVELPSGTVVLPKVRTGRSFEQCQAAVSEPEPDDEEEPDDELDDELDDESAELEDEEESEPDEDTFSDFEFPLGTPEPALLSVR